MEITYTACSVCGAICDSVMEAIQCELMHDQLSEIEVEISGSAATPTYTKSVLKKLIVLAPAPAAN